MGQSLEKMIQEGIARGETDFNLEQKSLTELPSEIEKLRDVAVRLALNQNYLTTLPAEIGALRKLRYLNVRSNQMRQFPVAILELPQLEILDISKNKITHLPGHLGHLQKTLKVLSISKNRIRSLPNCLGSMLELRMLKIDGNPLEYPPKDVLQSNPGTTMDVWLQQLKEFLVHSKRGGFLLFRRPIEYIPDTYQSTTRNRRSTNPYWSMAGTGKWDDLRSLLLNILGSSLSLPQQAHGRPRSRSASHAAAPIVVTSSRNAPSPASTRRPPPDRGLREQHDRELQREYQKRMELQQQLKLLQHRLRSLGKSGATGTTDETQLFSPTIDSSYESKMEAFYQYLIADHKRPVHPQLSPQHLEVLHSALIAASELGSHLKRYAGYISDPILDRELLSMMETHQGVMVSLVDQLMGAPSSEGEDLKAGMSALIQGIQVMLSFIRSNAKQFIGMLDVRLGKQLCMDIYVTMLHVKEAHDLLKPPTWTRPSPALSATSVVRPSPPTASSTIKVRSRNATPTKSSPSIAEERLQLSPARNMAISNSPSFRSLELPGSQGTVGSSTTATTATTTAVSPQHLKTIFGPTENATNAASYLLALFQKLFSEPVDRRPHHVDELSPLITTTHDVTQGLIAANHRLSTDPTALRRFHYEANLFIAQTTKLITAIRSLMVGDFTFSKSIVSGLQALTRTTRVLAMQLHGLGLHSRQGSSLSMNSDTGKRMAADLSSVVGGGGGGSPVAK